MLDIKRTSKLDSPVAKFFLAFIAYIITAVIVFVAGLSSSIVFEDFTHLGRAGAMITIIAISMAYKDFHLNFKNMSFEEAAKFLGKEQLFEIWSKSFVHKKRDELQKIKPGFNEADAIEFLNNLENISEDSLNKDQFIKSWLEEMFDIWSKKLRGWEFNMLKIGTVLWAFSDLLNKPLGW